MNGASGAPLRGAHAYGVRKGLLLCFPGTYSSARCACLGNVPGYCHSSRFAGLKGKELLAEIKFRASQERLGQR
jgi:hypothetical protein